MDYEQAKQLASSTDPALRRSLAADIDTSPELLYFLARDDDVSVRIAVADNPATPREADLLLARDLEDAVREHVGQKLGAPRPAVLPALSAKKQALTVTVAETLAEDGNSQVRVAIADALKDSKDAPTHVMQQLARDAEIRVAGPVLQHSPVLDDKDLIDVMNSGPIKGVLKAIAKRRNVSGGVSDLIVNRALASTDEGSAVTDLLQNDTARIQPGTMDRIIDEAPENQEWHRPLAARHDLNSQHMSRVASIPSDAIAETMSARSDLDNAAINALSRMVVKRMAALTAKNGEHAPTAKPAADAFMNAVMKGGKIGPVCAAISLRAGVHPEVAMRMLTSKNAKAIIALAWKAGLSATQAQSLQTGIGGIAKERALAPTGSGGFPIALPDLEWQLGLYVGSN